MSLNYCLKYMVKPTCRGLWVVLLSFTMGLTLNVYASDCATLDRADSLRRAYAYGAAVQEYVRVLDEGLLTYDCQLMAWVRKGLSHEGAIQMDSALESYAKVIELAASRKDSIHPFLGHAWMNSGLVQVDRGDISAALNSYDEAMKVYARADDLTSLDLARLNKAIAFRENGQNSEALQSYTQAAIGFESRNDLAMLAEAYSCIANLQVELGDMDKAGTFFQRSLMMRKELEDTITVASTLNNLGLLCQEIGQIDSARSCLYQALDLLQHRRGLQYAKTLHNTGVLELEDSRSESGRALIYEAIRIKRRIGGVETLAHSYLELARPRNEHAYGYAQRAYLDTVSSLIDDTSSPTLRLDYLEVKKEVFIAEGRMDSAIVYLDKARALEEQQYQEGYMRELAQLQEGYEAKSRSKHIDRLEEKTQTQGNELSALNSLLSNIKISLWVVGLIASLSIAVLVLLYHKKKKQTEHDRLLAEIQGQEAERERIARELHDTSANKLRLLRIEMLGLKNFKEIESSDQEVDRIEAELCKITDELIAISHRIHAPRESDRDIDTLLEDFIFDFAQQTGLEIDCRSTLGDSDITLTPSYSLHIYRIVQEALMNVYRHAQATMAKVELQTYADEIKLTISDNGRGIDPSSICGIGLENIRSRCELMKGSCKFENTSMGLAIDIRIPSER